MVDNRIERCFAKLKQNDQAALLTFVTAGHPDYDTSLEIIKALPDAGADIIEIGIPFSDPMADGPAIQLAGQRALARGQTLVKTLDMVREFRRDNEETPIILMGYYNPIYIYGNEQFLSDAKSAGVDGLIIVDVPAEADNELCIPAMQSELCFVRLIAPTTDDARLPIILKNASGFVYYVSITGITGTQTPNTDAVEAAVSRIKAKTDLPVVVGFGVNKPDQAQTIGRDADGVVVGSAIVSAIEASLDKNNDATNLTVKAVQDLVGDLSAGVKRARS